MNGRHRVLVFEPYWDAVYGNQRYLRMLGAGLARDGFDVHVVVPRRGALSESLKGERVSVHSLDNGASPGRLSGTGVPAMAATVIALRSLARTLDPTTVHANNLRSVMCIGPGARLLGVPILWYLKSMDGLRLARMAARLSTRQVAIGRALLERLDRGTGVTDEDVVPLGAPEIGKVRDRSEMRQELDIEHNRLVVLLAASVNPNKGIHRGVEAVARLVSQGRDPLLLVAGEARGRMGDEYLDSLRISVTALGLERQVRFLGYREDVPDLLGASDVLLLPSDKEGVPRSIVEAMQCGVPVVASSTGGIPETVIEGETGYLVPVGDVDNMTIRLAELLDDPARRKAFGAAARERAPLYSIERNVATIGAMHRELAAKGGRISAR